MFKNEDFAFNSVTRVIVSLMVISKLIFELLFAPIESLLLKLNSKLSLSFLKIVFSLILLSIFIFEAIFFSFLLQEKRINIDKIMIVNDFFIKLLLTTNIQTNYFHIKNH